MPHSYSRSRARTRVDYSGDRGYAPRPKGSGNGLMFALAGVIVVGLLVGAGFVFKDTLLEAFNGGSTPVPTVSPSAVTTAPIMEASPSPSVEPSQEPTALPSTTPEPAVTPAVPQQVSICVVGNMIFDDSELTDAKESGEYSFAPFLDNIKDSLSKADVTLGTLETSLMGKDKKYDGAPKYNTPDSILDALKGTGFDALNTAHSHIFDYGYSGMEKTRQKILDSQMLSIGTYISKQDYHTPVFLPADALKIAVLSYCEKENNASAVPKANMSYAIKSINLESMKKGINEAREGGAQAVIVLLHWDKYTLSKPTAEMKTLARKLLESGADVVLGSGPKYVMSVEKMTGTRSDGTAYNGIVAYSLGNFISAEAGAKADSGLILNLSVRFDSATRAVTTEASYVPTYMYSKSGRDFSVLPSGKYKDDPALLDTLSASGKGRVPKAWQETVDAVANSDLKPMPE